MHKRTCRIFRWGVYFGVGGLVLVLLSCVAGGPTELSIKDYKATSNKYRAFADARISGTVIEQDESFFYMKGSGNTLSFITLEDDTGSIQVFYDPKMYKWDPDTGDKLTVDGGPLAGEDDAMGFSLEFFATAIKYTDSGKAFPKAEGAGL